MLEHLIEGGSFMWVLVGLSVLALGIAMERFFALREAEVDTDGLLDDVASTIDNGDLDGAIQVCETTSGPVAETMAVGLRKLQFLEYVGKEADEIEKGMTEAMEEHGAHVVAHLERFLPALGTIAALGPIIGMLGTVVGMIDAFGNIEAAGNVEADAVAGGIKTALLTTAGGLIVAVPATVFYNYFSSRVTRLVLQVQASGSEMMERLLEASVQGDAEEQG